MLSFPLFINIEQKKCVIIGGGNVAQRKIETLIGFGALITVISPNVTEKIRKLSEADLLTWICKTYSERDIVGAYMVIAATCDVSINERIYQEAVRNNIFVNVADSSEKCTFIFPSVVRRDELVIGISTSGNYPALSKKVKEELEKAVPPDIGPLISLIKEYRTKVINKIEDANAKKLVLRRVADELFSCSDMDLQCFQKRIDGILEEFCYEKGNKGRNP